MCRIAGLIRFAGTLAADGRIEAMADTLYHRGPDDCGFAKFLKVHFGFRRLAIIDLKTGNQPLYNENRTVCVLFNGEIYNFAE